MSTPLNLAANAVPADAPPPKVKSRAPAGPRGALWQTVRYVSNPLAFYLDCSARYGETFTVPSVLGKVVAISRPAHLRALFSLPPEDFERWSVDAVAPLLGASSVLLSSGDLHLQQRRMMAPAFHGVRIQALADKMGAIAQKHFRQWPENHTFTLQPKFIALSIDIILGVVLGVDDERRLRQLREAILKVVSTIGPGLMLARAVSKHLSAFGPYRKFLHARGELDALLFEQIDSAIKAHERGERAHHMLDMLLAARDPEGRGYSRDELRDQLMTLIFAGHETSAIALTWGVYWLNKCPDVLAALEQEIDGLADFTPEYIAKLPYLDAVCKETLRLHPTVPEVIRKLKKPLVLDGLLLPAGTVVAACIVATHHREDLYADASRFLPGRFEERRYTAAEYLPFGGGVHRCAGEAFAWLEMKMILANLVKERRFVLAGKREVTPVLRSITMEPRGGVPVIMRRRVA